MVVVVLVVVVVDVVVRRRRGRRGRLRGGRRRRVGWLRRCARGECTHGPGSEAPLEDLATRDLFHASANSGVQRVRASNNRDRCHFGIVNAATASSDARDAAEISYSEHRASAVPTWSGEFVISASTGAVVREVGAGERVARGEPARPARPPSDARRVERELAEVVRDAGLPAAVARAGGGERGRHPLDRELGPVHAHRRVEEQRVAQDGLDQRADLEVGVDEDRRQFGASRGRRVDAVEELVQLAGDERRGTRGCRRPRRSRRCTASRCARGRSPGW